LDVRLRPIIARALAQMASRARELDASQCRHSAQVRVSPGMAKCAWPSGLVGDPSVQIGEEWLRR
jgi:hypothetical protein